MHRTVFSTLFATLCAAEVICKPNVPPNLIPPLPSCDYAMRRLAATAQTCGTNPIVFSPTAHGPNVLSLPAIYVGAGTDYTPATRVWCAIMILWQPRPGARPAVEGLDVFRFSKVVKAAREIRDRCLWGGAPRKSMIGREWVEPNQWVDVQFAGVFGPEMVSGWGNFSGGGDGVVMLADGTNLSVVLPSLLDEMRGCGGLTDLGVGTVGEVE